MENIFFSGWEKTFRRIILTVLGYLSIEIIRISGKRTLSKTNVFDFVVTVALGSCLASISLNKGVSLLDESLSFSLFIFLQFLLTYLSVKVKGFRTLITSKPKIVFYEGLFLEKEMKNERISKEDILNAGRLQGYSNLDNIYIIVLEATGDFQ